MVTLRAFGPLFAGFATIVTLAIVTRVLMRRLTPEWIGASGSLPSGAAFVNLASGFFAAAAGGYATAWAAPGNPLVYVLVLAIGVLALNALSTLQSRGKQPIAYQLSLIAVPALGAMAGGLVRLRVEGIL